MRRSGPGSNVRREPRRCSRQSHYQRQAAGLCLHPHTRRLPYVFWQEYFNRTSLRGTFKGGLTRSPKFTIKMPLVRHKCSLISRPGATQFTCRCDHQCGSGAAVSEAGAAIASIGNNGTLSTSQLASVCHLPGCAVWHVLLRGQRRADPRFCCRSRERPLRRSRWEA
jgi:hypothetical protein